MKMMKKKQGTCRRAATVTVLMATILAPMFLLILTGCLNEGLLPFRAALVITVRDANNNPIENNVYFNMGGAAKVFSAMVTGADNIASYDWTLVKGDDVVTLTKNGASATVSPLKVGDAKITVKAVTSDDSVETEFNIYVNPAGFTGNWTFKIMSGSIEIYDGDSIEVPPTETRTVTLTATTAESVTFTWQSNSTEVVSINPASGTTSTINALKEGEAVISIRATKGAENLTKTFTVIVAEPGVLFKWDSESSPLSGATITANTPYSGGYKGIYFGARSNAITVEDGAFKLGTGSSSGTAYSVLMIGSGSETGAATPYGAQTSSTTHAPGQFDFRSGTFRLTVNYKDPVYNAGAANNVLLRVQINNNRDGQGNSILGDNNNTGHNVVRAYSSIPNMESGTSNTNARGVTDTSVPGTMIVTFSPAIRYAGNENFSTLGNAFFSFFTGPAHSVTITAIKLERVQ